MTAKRIFTLLTLAPLTLCPGLVLAAPAAESEPPAPALEPLDFSEVLAAVVEADNAANVDPVEAAPGLSAALAELDARVDAFAGDEQVLETRRMARLNLARAYLKRDEDELARETMDRAIRDNLGHNLPVEIFGDDIEALYFERMTALEEAGWVTLEVACALACEVFVNETEVSAETMELPPGPYRLVVHSTKGERDDLVWQIELDPAANPKLVNFRLPLPKPPPMPVEKPVQRLMPMGAEVALIVLGTGLSMAGAGLVGYGSIQSRLPSTVVLAGPDRSSMIGVGVPFMLIGLASLTSGTVSLAIDQTRVGPTVDRRAVVNWQMQF